MLTPDEYARVAAHLDGETAFAAELAVRTLLRRGELLRLRWRDIDLAAGTLTVAAESAKNAEERTVPLPPRLVAVLAARAGMADDGVLRLTPAMVRRGWATACRKAGVRARWHDLRHTGRPGLRRPG